MDATTVAVDLAKNVFEIAVADASGRILKIEIPSRNYIAVRTALP